MRRWPVESSAPREVALALEPSRLGLPEVVEGIDDRRDVALVPATDEQMIAALGRAFAFACAEAEKRGR